MGVFRLPARVILVGVEPPSQDEVRPVLVAPFQVFDDITDPLGELTVLPIGRAVTVRKLDRIARDGDFRIRGDTGKTSVAFTSIRELASQFPGQFLDLQLRSYLHDCLAPA